MDAGSALQDTIQRCHPNKVLNVVHTIPLSLEPRAIEKIATQCVMDIKLILVLDGIDILPDGFRVSSHDLHGQARCPR
jgi:hypothetical protein